MNNLEEVFKLLGAVGQYEDQYGWGDRVSTWIITHLRNEISFIIN